MTHQPNNVSAADEQILWSATPDGMACRKKFEIAQGQPRFDVEFNPTTEHYHRDNGIGFICIATDTEWQLWQKAWRAAASAQATGQAVPDGWKLVPVEPTMDMVIDGFESAPSLTFSKQEDWEAFEAMSGCQQAAHRARLCYAAMLAARTISRRARSRGRGDGSVASNGEKVGAMAGRRRKSRLSPNKRNDDSNL